MKTGPHEPLYDTRRGRTQASRRQPNDRAVHDLIRQVKGLCRGSMGKVVQPVPA